MKTFLFSFLLALASPIVLSFFIDILNCLYLSIFLSLLLLSITHIAYLKKSGTRSVKAVIFSLVILVFLSYFFMYLHLHTFLDKAAFSLPWGSVFFGERFSIKVMGMEFSKISRWDFEKPNCYLSEYALIQKCGYPKSPVKMNMFVYHNKRNVQIYFNEYVEKLKSREFSDKLNLPINTSPSELKVVDYVTLTNGTTVVHCELLVMERSDKAAILVVLFNKSEVDTLNKILK